MKVRLPSYDNVLYYKTSAKSVIMQSNKDNTYISTCEPTEKQSSACNVDSQSELRRINSSYYINALPSTFCSAHQSGILWLLFFNFLFKSTFLSNI